MNKTTTIKDVTYEEARHARSALGHLIGASPGMLPEEHPIASMYRKLDEAVKCTEPV